MIEEINLICNELDNNGKKKKFCYWYPLLVSMIVIIKYEVSEIYKKYFTKQKNSNYINDEISLSNSSYNKFLVEIKGKKIEKLLNLMIQNHNIFPMGKSFILYFINTFDPVHKINKQDLSKYLYESEGRVTRLLEYLDDCSYPYLINNIINKINDIKFN